MRTFESPIKRTCRPANACLIAPHAADKDEEEEEGGTNSRSTEHVCPYEGQATARKPFCSPLFPLFSFPFSAGPVHVHSALLDSSAHWRINAGSWENCVKLSGRPDGSKTSVIGGRTSEVNVSAGETDDERGPREEDDPIEVDGADGKAAGRPVYAFVADVPPLPTTGCEASGSSKSS